MLALLSFGCSADGFFLGLPPLGSAQTLLLAVTEGAARRVEVIDLSREAPVRSVAFSDGIDLAFEAWLYDSSLSDLDLEPGPLQFLGPEAGVPLPAPELAFAARVWDGEVVPWAARPATEVEGLGLRVSGRDRCARFDVRSYAFGSDFRPAFAVTLVDGSVLLGGPDAGLSRLSASGLEALENPVREVITNGSLEPVAPVSRLWIRTASGKLYAGLASLPLELERVATATVPEAIDFRAGFGPDGEAEVFVLGTDARFYRLQGQQTEVLHAFTRAPVLDLGGVARAARGDAMAVYFGDPAAVHRRPEGVLVTEVTSNALESLTAVSYESSYVVLTSQGGVLGLDPAGWRELGRGPNIELFASVPFEEGRFVTGGNGFAAQLVTGRGFCRAIPAGGVPAVHIALLEGRHPVLIPGNAEFGESGIRIRVLFAE